MAQIRVAQDRLMGALRRDAVKKNVAAIHVSGKLTLLQRKLSNVLLLNAYDELVTRASHSIDAKTLAAMVGYNSNDVETLRQSLRGLAETVAEWDMLDKSGRHEWGVSSLLSFARLSGGVCEYAYSAALAEKLHDPDVFAMINIRIQSAFGSGHALALYENCYRFVNIGSTGWWDLETFRRLVGVEESAYYQSFKHLNAKIIKPAVAEVNRISNIVIDPEVRKKGRAVTDIRFSIRKNAQLPMLDIDDGAGLRRGAVYGRLVANGVSDRLARQWITEFGEDAVREKLDYVGRRTDVTNPAGYMATALRDGGRAGAPGPSAPAPGRQARAAARDRAAARALDRETAEREDAVKDRERQGRVARLERVLEQVEARNPTQRDADRRLFLSTLADEVERDNFRRFGWQSGVNASAIFAFWENMVPNLFDDL